MSRQSSPLFRQNMQKWPTCFKLSFIEPNTFSYITIASLSHSNSKNALELSLFAAYYIAVISTAGDNKIYFSQTN